MNAHTTIAPEPQAIPNVLEYGPAVWMHYPDEAGVRLSLRCDLMAFRDRAALGLMRCSPEAMATLQEASRIAMLYALANMPTKALFQMHIAVRSLIDAATAIEAALKPGGKDARG